MKRLSLLASLLFISVIGFSNAIIVRNIDELNAANKQAQPGDIIVLQNGEWKNVIISLNCSGTKERPIIFKAQTDGQVIISGHSMLKLGGTFIVVGGLNFINGYAGDDAVVDFRIDKKQLANNCRVTNCVIDGFDNPKRLQENNWISFSGKNNRLDHCSFLNKKNLGVLLAVILDDDRSRENFHSIDHNYFGVRIPLASNGGEIIRVGLAQHCQFNSNTQIADNFFEHCDGETEIISIKSCGNVVRNNVFKECQGGVVLRHGNYNTVANNIFLGNDKEGTGGVRVINKGQWVINNLFYKCRGLDFRSPLSVMNGIPNSPATRYVQVTDAVIANNTWYNCSPASFCEGSDSERTLPPFNTTVINNIFYNTRDSIIYRAFDKTSGFSFAGNEMSKDIKQRVDKGFITASFTTQKNGNSPFVVSGSPTAIPDSLQQLARQRLGHALVKNKGFSDLPLMKKIQANAYRDCGAQWFGKGKPTAPARPIVVSCSNAEEVYIQLDKKQPLILDLTGKQYKLTRPMVISAPVELRGNKSNGINIYAAPMQAAFLIGGNGKLTLSSLNINGSDMKAASFIASDSTGLSDHYNLVISNCSMSGFNRHNGCQNLFLAYKSIVADSIIVRNCTFIYNNTNGFMLSDEKDNKGYYNVEKMVICNNDVSGFTGTFLALYRGGSDESTMGPKLEFTKNNIRDCLAYDPVAPFIQLTGAQQTNLSDNIFTNCNKSSDETTGKLISYIDFVRANHNFRNNRLTECGAVHVNKFVIDRGNVFVTSFSKYY